MQDRFKFRFWHKPTEKMVNCYGYNPDFVFGDVLDGIGTEYNPAKFKDCILMQCTGLKDDNGKLIFEGDIVEVQYIDAQIPLFKNEYTQEPNAEIFEIAYSEEWHNFVAKNDNYKKTCEVHSLDLSKIQINKDNKIYKIVGNIYENADLLEVKDADIQS